MNQGPTPEQIEELRQKFPHNQLYQLETPDGHLFIVRGSSYDEFSRLVKASNGNQTRMALQIVQQFVVWPELDPQDLEYNKSGDWGPGLIAALSEHIQEVLGYSKEITVKKL